MTKRVRSWAVALGCLFVFLGFAACARADTPAKLPVGRLMDSLFKQHTFRQTAISFDGSHVAWVENLRGKDNEASENAAIYAVALSAPSAARRITAGDGVTPHSEHDVAWSRDGRYLAFLSDQAQQGELQLYIVPAAGGTPRQLTHVKGLLTHPQWSPDGKSVAVLFTEDLPKAAGPMAPKPRLGGVVESKIYEQRIAVVDPQSGQIRQVSPAYLYVHEYDWSPDGNAFVATAAPGEGNSNWYVAELYTVSVGTGETKLIYKPSYQVAAPRWSPDGESIAFIEGLMSDEVRRGATFSDSLRRRHPRQCNVRNESNRHGDPLAALFQANRVRGKRRWRDWRRAGRRFNASDHHVVARGGNDHRLRLVDGRVSGRRRRHIGSDSQFAPARAGNLGGQNRLLEAAHAHQWFTAAVVRRSQESSLDQRPV